MASPLRTLVYRNMVKTKKNFKNSLRQCRKDVEIHKNNALAAALQVDKTNQNFWQKIKDKSISQSLPTLVGGVNGGSEIDKVWKDYFKGILNSASESAEFVKHSTNCKENYLGTEMVTGITYSKAALEQGIRVRFDFCRTLAVCR